MYILSYVAAYYHVTLCISDAPSVYNGLDVDNVVLYEHTKSQLEIVPPFTNLR
jgi:hypothetical protein